MTYHQLAEPRYVHYNNVILKLISPMLGNLLFFTKSSLYFVFHCYNKTFQDVLKCHLSLISSQCRLW